MSLYNGLLALHTMTLYKGPRHSRSPQWEIKATLTRYMMRFRCTSQHPWRVLLGLGRGEDAHHATAWSQLRQHRLRESCRSILTGHRSNQPQKLESSSTRFSRSHCVSLHRATGVRTVPLLFLLFAQCPSLGHASFVPEEPCPGPLGSLVNSKRVWIVAGRYAGS
jgi:hypothetical protein